MAAISCNCRGVSKGAITKQKGLVYYFVFYFLNQSFNAGQTCRNIDLEIQKKKLMKNND